MSELLSCPFCGRAPKLDEQGVRGFDDSAWTFIRCNSCGIRPQASASVPWRWAVQDGWEQRVHIGRTTEEATSLATQRAIENWNRRAPQPEPVKMTEIDLADDDALRFVQRVLESDAPDSDRLAARQMVSDIRTRVRREFLPQPEPAAPTPDTFMGEPVLTRWKPLNRDDSRLALHQSMHNRSFGNPSDDKLMLEWLWENGYALCKRVPDEAAPTPQQQALDRMVENAETLGLYEAAPTEATLDQMAGKAWDRFQRRTAELQALENCRLYAARHRKEDWAATILRFCAEGGATGSPLREAAPTVVEPETWAGYDLDGMVEAFHRVIEAHANKNNPFHNPIDADAQMALRILRGLVPAMKAYAPTPPRAALTDEQIDKIIVAQWGTHPSVIFKAHRAFARAVIAADRAAR